MERREFESLPPSFYEEVHRRKEPRWLLMVGAICVLGSLAVAAVMLLGRCNCGI